MFVLKNHLLIKLRIADLVREKYKNSHPDALKTMAERLENEPLIQSAVKGMHQGSSNAAGAEGGPRTSASPEWDGSPPWNFRKTMDATAIPAADFDTANSLLDNTIITYICTC